MALAAWSMPRTAVAYLHGFRTEGAHYLPIGAGEMTDPGFSYFRDLPMLFGKPVDQLADVWDFVCTICQQIKLRESYSPGLGYAFDNVD